MPLPLSVGTIVTVLPQLFFSVMTGPQSLRHMVSGDKTQVQDAATEKKKKQGLCLIAGGPVDWIEEPSVEVTPYHSESYAQR